MTKTTLFEDLSLVHWNLFGIWCLLFGAYHPYYRVITPYI